MLRTLLTLTTVAALAAPASAGDLPRPAAAPMVLPRHGVLRTPGIRIWTSGSDLHRRGDRVRLYYRTEEDAYVTIFRVDTDGRVRVLFPRDPDDNNYGYGGATYAVSNYDRNSAFYVDDYPGVGYLFGVASSEPFDFDAIRDYGHWDLHGISDGRIHGDPRAELEDMLRYLLPSDYGDYDTHLIPYYVDRRYDYPRFVCYDCHAYTPWIAWDPYRAWCSRYTLVVFNDPFYYYPSYWYPTRYYGGTRVVYGGRREPTRYVFKTRANNGGGITFRDRSRTSQAVPATRDVADRGVRGRDIGGVGTVPAPRSPTRRVTPGGRTGQDVPAPATQPATGGRRRVDRSDGPMAPPRPERLPGERPSPADGRRSPADRPTPQGEPQRPSTGDNGRAPEARPQPDQQPSGGDNRRAPDARPAPQPEQRPSGGDNRRTPEARPAPQPEQRPSGGDSRRAPESRPAPASPQDRTPAERPRPETIGAGVDRGTSELYRMPTYGTPPGYGDEPRPVRPDIRVTRPEAGSDLTPNRDARPDVQSRAPERLVVPTYRPSQQAQPEGNRSAPQSRPRASEPRAAPQPRESRPQRSPPRESRPQASPPRESRPQASPPRSQPQASPPRQSRPQPSTPRLERRRPD